MSLPLDLVYEIKKGSRKAINLSDFNRSSCKDDLIYIKNYRTFEYYKRLSGRYVFARNLLPREIDDFYFNNGQSFRGCTVIEK